MITILSSQTSDRLTYVLDFIFRDVLDAEYVFVSNVDLIPQHTRICVVYEKNPEIWTVHDPSIRIPAHTLLFENGLGHSSPEVHYHKNGAPYLFKTDEPGEIEFDLFSMVFFLITRYEEYSSQKKDAFGRFPAKESLAYKNRFLELPIVDIWIRFLAKQIEEKTGIVIHKKQHFSIFPTIDIDKVWAFAYPSFSSWKGWLKDLVLCRFSSLKDRLTSVRHPGKDPFFTFDVLEKHLFGAREAPLFFILFARQPKGNDINHSRELVPFREWLKSFGNSRETGMHPSMASNRDPGILQEEKNALSSVLEKQISASRQHFIQLSFPHTYQNLLCAGIRDEYSMGYPDHTGFRASTACSFWWFDLTTNKKTELRIHPFQIMDVTLKKYLALSPDDAVEYCQNMINLAKKEDIPLRFIWHNSSFYSPYGWKNWEKVFAFLCKRHDLS